MALVENESEYVSLALGDHFSMGVFQGLGFRVSGISFEAGTITITNGAKSVRFLFNDDSQILGSS